MNQTDPHIKTCPRCSGRGFVDSPLSLAALFSGEAVNPDEIDCPDCFGRGEVDERYLGKGTSTGGLPTEAEKRGAPSW